MYLNFPAALSFGLGWHLLISQATHSVEEIAKRIMAVGRSVDNSSKPPA
jgi:hypothetical protein